jgi:hypothetical protein
MDRKLTFIRGFFLLCLVICCLPTASLAADKVVVIPLFGHGKPLKNVVTVAKSGGKFTDPVAAVNSITDASENNPYLVVIAPGVYTLTQTLVMKPWVDITGSGENVTKLTGAISSGYDGSGSAIVKSAARTVLSDLTVVNTGGGEYSVGIYTRQVDYNTTKLNRITVEASGGKYNRGIINEFHSSIQMNQITATARGGTRSYAIFNTDSASPSMTQVRATATNATINIGVFNDHFSSPSMIEVNVYARRGDTAYGIRNVNSTPKMTQVTVKAYEATTSNYGVYNFGSSPTMVQVTATATEGTHNYGVYNYHSSPVMSQVRATASGGNDCYGIYNENNSSTIIRRSTLSGCVRGIFLDVDGITVISQSTIKYGVWSSGGVLRCVACDDGNGNALDAQCQ